MAQIMRVRVTIGAFQGAPGLQTFYFAGPGDATQGEADEAVARVSAYLDAAKNFFAQFSTWTPQDAVDVINQGTGVLEGSFVTTTAAPVTGGASGGATMTGTAAVLTLNTGVIVNGRRLVGRSFVAPIPPGALNSAGQLDSTWRSGLLATTSNFTTTITEGISPVVWHRPVSGAGGTAAIVSGYSISSKPGMIKSRRD